MRRLPSLASALGLLCGVVSGAGLGASAAQDPSAVSPPRWSAERAWTWYRQQPWIVGFNYVPSTAANTTEFWSAEAFDEKTIDRELGWGAGLGFNSCRVFVQYLVWKNDPAGLKRRLDRFLAIADRHGLTTTLVLFDDCAFGDPPQTEPYLGKQREPIPGMILPSWTPSPGLKAVTNTNAWPDLERYIKDIVGSFGQDKRVLLWDLYNEPGNSGLGNRSLPLVGATFAWARAARPSQPLTMSPWGAPAEISRRQLELSDVISFHFYGNYEGLRNQIVDYKKHLRPVISTEWMARLQGSRWASDLPLFKHEAVGCYSWGLVNGRTQCQFAWFHRRGTPEPKVWFHDLFHQDGRPFDAAEHEAIRQTTANKAIDWAATDYTQPQTAPGGPPPRLLFGDATRHGRPFAKDPSVLRLGQRYLMYYSMVPATNKALPKGWAIGIAESRDLVNWQKAGEILPAQTCEQNGLVNGKALLIGGRVHLFYNSYGNGRNDALCHAVSDDGLRFTRDPSNPILRSTGTWNSGRAIDCDAFECGGRLWLIYATRDPSMQTQMLAAATADLKSGFGRGAWTPVGDGPILKPELPWETRCIEAPSVLQRGGTLYLFYGGGYNNDPQQIGCAVSTDGRRWTRLFREPLIPNGRPGDWNSSETGHPGVFEDADGRTYLFVQGNHDKGRTWFISAYELTWEGSRPAVRWDSPKFPMKRSGPAAHSEDGIAFSEGWTCWTGAGPKGDHLHYANRAGTTASWETQGETVTLIHKIGPDCGVARVLIDGQPANAPQLDTYSPTVEWNRRTVLATNLSPGRHTVNIVNLGTKHEKSSNTYVQIVGFE
jgi:beta-1,2-mannobiose phosphorylase / 1,2-beta-oligomannan phosphorylase